MALFQILLKILIKSVLRNRNDLFGIIVVDYADTRFSQILFENENVRETVFACSIVHMGPRSNLLSKKNGQTSRDTVPLIPKKYSNVICIR